MSSKSLNWKKQKQIEGLCTVCGVRPLVTKWHCRECADSYNAFKRKRRDAGHCKRCGKVKTLVNTWMCAECAGEARLIKGAANHGIGLDEYKQMLARGCAICGTHENLNVDHDHTCCNFGRRASKSCAVCTRGILCATHNILIGWLEHADAVAGLRYLQGVRTSAPLVTRLNRLEKHYYE